MNTKQFIEHLFQLKHQAVAKNNKLEFVAITELIKEAKEASSPSDVDNLIAKYQSIRNTYDVVEEPDYTLPSIEHGDLSRFIRSIKKYQPVRFGELSPNHETLLFTAYANKLIDIDEGEIYVSSTAYAQLAQ